jgi:hypothetical protein
MKILFIGDIMGSGGRKLVQKYLPGLKEKYSVDLVVANIDNLAHGKGATPKTVRSMRNAGIDVMTGGNHVFDRREMMEKIDDFPEVLRGANYTGEVPGKFICTGEVNAVPYLVATFMGQTFMGSFESPFNAYTNYMGNNFQDIPVKIIDFHAETTSEKQAFGYYLKGRVSAVIGTHTHVQTADEHILPGGTAFITDVGMTGPHNGIIGMDAESVMPRFLQGLPTRFEPAAGRHMFHGCVFEVDDESGKALSIERISLAGDLA